MSSNDQPSEQDHQNASNLSDEVASRIRQTIIGDGKVTSDKMRATPKSTRFQKGVSGNPMGRPRTKAGAAGKQNKGSIEVSEHAYQLAIDRIILEFADKELTVKVGDELVKMSGRKALAQAQAKAALNGNAHAQKDIQNRIERAERAQLRERAEDAMFWRDYKSVMKAELERRAEEGTEIDEEALLPHPGDVEINNDLTIRFTGPTTLEALSKCKETMRYRSALILQAELDVRLADDDADMPGQGALVMAYVLESSLPARMRFSDADWFNAVWKTQTINKRTLLKQVRQAWRDAFTDRGGRLDTNVRRGLQFPDTHAVQNLVTDLQDFCHEAAQNDWQISDADAEELCDIANEFGDQLRQTNGS